MDKLIVLGMGIPYPWPSLPTSTKWVKKEFGVGYVPNIYCGYSLSYYELKKKKEKKSST